MSKSKKAIGLDVDSVLRDVIPTIMDVFKDKYPDKVISDYVQYWDFPNVLLPLSEKNKVFDEYAQKIFFDSKPFPFVIKQFEYLKSFAKSEGFDFYCVSSQKPGNEKYTDQWLEKHNLTFDKIIYAKEKQLLDLTYLIDDSLTNRSKWTLNGNPEPNFILFDASHNQTANVKSRCYNFLEVIDYIKGVESYNGWWYERI